MTSKSWKSIIIFESMQICYGLLTCNWETLTLLSCLCKPQPVTAQILAFIINIERGLIHKYTYISKTYICIGGGGKLRLVQNILPFKRGRGIICSYQRIRLFMVIRARLYTRLYRLGFESRVRLVWAENIRVMNCDGEQLEGEETMWYLPLRWGSPLGLEDNMATVLVCHSSFMHTFASNKK